MAEGAACKHHWYGITAIAVLIVTSLFVFVKAAVTETTFHPDINLGEKTVDLIVF